MTTGTIVLLTFQMTNNVGVPLPGEHIDVEMDAVRTIELVAPAIHIDNKPLATSSWRFRFTFTNGDQLHVYAAPVNDPALAKARRSGLSKVLRRISGAHIDVFDSEQDVERASAETD